MIRTIRQYCDALVLSFNDIPSERRNLLEKISEYVSLKLSSGQIAELNYICTHNSRRSHFGQIWGQVAAAYYNLSGVATYSGGTEVTAFHPNAIATLKRIGFDVQIRVTGSNPVYDVYFTEGGSPCICFSKRFDDHVNPSGNFAAIMTCDDAEANCPFVPGAEFRISTTYADPKAGDGRPDQDMVYDARCRQIALESLYVFSKVKLK